MVKADFKVMPETIDRASSYCSVSILELSDRVIVDVCEIALLLRSLKGKAVSDGRAQALTILAIRRGRELHDWAFGKLIADLLPRLCGNVVRFVDE